VEKTCANRWKKCRARGDFVIWSATKSRADGALARAKARHLFCRETHRHCACRRPRPLYSYASYPPTEYLLPQNVDFLPSRLPRTPAGFRKYLARLQNLAEDNRSSWANSVSTQSATRRRRRRRFSTGISTAWSREALRERFSSRGPMSGSRRKRDPRLVVRPGNAIANRKRRITHSRINCRRRGNHETCPAPEYPRFR